MSYTRNVSASADCTRRLNNIRAKRTPIDPVRLAELAGDPSVKSDAIARHLGFGRAGFFEYLANHEDLWNVYEAARLRAGKKVAKWHLRVRRGPLTEDELKILNAIEQGARTDSEIAAASGVSPQVFGARLYNLENEKHEIWSQVVGGRTHYFLREREQSAEGEGQRAKGKAA